MSARFEDAAHAGEVWQEADNVLLLCITPRVLWRDWRGDDVPWNAPTIARPLRRLLDAKGNLALAAQEGDDTQRADHYQHLYEQVSEGKCGHSGMSLAGCKRSICDCFEFGRVAALADATGALAKRDTGIRAAALREAAKDLYEDWVKHGRHQGQPGCYSPGYERWLRDRADRIEAEAADR